MPHSEQLVELLESADVARELGVTPATARVLAVKRLIPVAAVTPRGSRLFRRADVIAFRERLTLNRGLAADTVPAKTIRRRGAKRRPARLR